jgi:ACR3 family arsenite transporter
MKQGEEHFDAAMTKIGPWTITALLVTLVLLFTVAGVLIEVPIMLWLVHMVNTSRLVMTCK